MSFVTQTQGINPQGVEEADVFALAQEGGHTCVQVFFFRSGQNWGNHAYFPQRRQDATEPLKFSPSFIGQFYDDRPLPQAHPAVARDRGARAAGRSLLRPMPGTRWKCTCRSAARRSSSSTMPSPMRARPKGRKLAETSSQSKLLEGVAKAFGLEAPPHRIEIYDNSHIQGAHAVGGMVVAGPEGFMKSQYRKFNIKPDGSGGR